MGDDMVIVDLMGCFSSYFSFLYHLLHMCLLSVIWSQKTIKSKKKKIQMPWCLLLKLNMCVDVCRSHQGWDPSGPNKVVAISCSYFWSDIKLIPWKVLDKQVAHSCIYIKEA